GKFEVPLSAHRGVIIQNSSFFHQFLSQNALSNELEFFCNLFDAGEVKRVLSYLYTSKFTFPLDIQEGIRTFACAAFYGVPALMKVITDGFDDAFIMLDHVADEGSKTALVMALREILSCPDRWAEASVDIILRRLLGFMSKLNLQTAVL